MTYNDIWRRLAKVYPDNEAKAISRLLMEDLFGLSLSDIICGAADCLSDDSCRVLEEAVQRLEKSEPIQYVTGKALFCDRLFHVEPGVLIPRPETEQLCRLVVEGVKDVPHPDILDIGTGSGCIATTLSLDIPEARLSAWDVSDKALSIAAANAEALGARVCFSKQDALNAPDDEARWDAIVSNPPYICDREKADMERNVLDNEPHLALFVPDSDPLLFYRSISEYAARSLRDGGLLFFEINEHYANDTSMMLQRLGFDDIRTIKDIFDKDRNIVCRKR